MSYLLFKRNWELSKRPYSPPPRKPKKQREWLRWVDGRQGGDYQRMLLLRSKLLKFDFYLLRLPTGSVVRPHIDRVPDGFEHHRINVTLREATSGGITFIDPKVVSREKSEYERAPKHYRFRPDIHRHHVTKVEAGSVLLLSFGWLKRST